MLKIALVVLRSADIEASRHFYEALGVSMAPTETQGYLGKVSGIHLEICPANGNKVEGMRIGFRCARIVTVVGALKAAGGTVVRTLGSPKLMYAVVRDPDGHTLELRNVD